MEFNLRVFPGFSLSFNWFLSYTTSSCDLYWGWSWPISFSQLIFFTVLVEALRWRAFRETTLAVPPARSTVSAEPSHSETGLLDIHLPVS
jgi:hypothetical protein